MRQTFLPSFLKVQGTYTSSQPNLCNLCLQLKIWEIFCLLELELFWTCIKLLSSAVLTSVSLLVFGKGIILFLKFPTLIIIIAFCPYWSIGCLQELSRHPDPGPASQAVPRYNKTFVFSLQIMATGVSWAALLSLFLWVPSWGLTCDTGHLLFEGFVQSVPSVFHSLWRICSVLKLGFRLGFLSCFKNTYISHSHIADVSILNCWTLISRELLKNEPVFLVMLQVLCEKVAFEHDCTPETRRWSFSFNCIPHSSSSVPFSPLLVKGNFQQNDPVVNGILLVPHFISTVHMHSPIVQRLDAKLQCEEVGSLYSDGVEGEGCAVFTVVLLTSLRSADFGWGWWLRKRSLLFGQWKMIS